MKYTPQNGQDIFDVLLQNFGDIESGLFPTLKTNGLNINTRTLFGEELTLNNEGVGVEKVKNYFLTSNFTTNNSDELTFIKFGDFNSDFNKDFL